MHILFGFVFGLLICENVNLSTGEMIQGEWNWLKTTYSRRGVGLPALNRNKSINRVSKWINNLSYLLQF